MAVQLRVRRVPVYYAACGRVQVLSGDQLPRRLLDHLTAIAATHSRHHLRQIARDLLHRGSVRDLHVPPLRVQVLGRPLASVIVATTIRARIAWLP